VRKPNPKKGRILVQNAIESTTLYYCSGSSDKVYQASIEPVGNDKFHVAFAYGRRGSTLTTGVKTTEPVDLAKAKSIYGSLVKSKTSKGYSSGFEGTPYAGSVNAPQDTGIHCQLLNPIDEVYLETCLASDHLLMQQKFDGRRLLVRKCDGKIVGINRRGLAVGLPESIVKSAGALPGNFIIDGEAVGDVLYAFDVLEKNGRCLRKETYLCRLKNLSTMLSVAEGKNIMLVGSAFSPNEKKEMFNQLHFSGAEGVVFKDINAPHTPGRPNSGGSHLKFKFHKSATCLVTGRNGDRRSVSLALFKDSQVTNCGNVAIPVNHDIPKDGAVVEVRYLYAMPGSHALYQPVYLGVRDDMIPTDCLLDQLEYKTVA